MIGGCDEASWKALTQRHMLVLGDYAQIGDLLGQNLVYVWQVHLDAMLGFIDIVRHPVEFAGLVELRDGVTVEL